MTESVYYASDVQFQFEVNNNCTLCGNCVQSCSSNSLSIKGGGLYLNVSDCWKCEVCQIVCKNEAIHLTYTVTDPNDADNVKQDDFIVKLFEKGGS